MSRTAVLPEAALIAGALAAGLMTFGLRASATASRPPELADALVTPVVPPHIARPLSFGFHPLAADVRFLEAIQVHGQRQPRDAEDKQFRDDRLLVRLVSDAIELDPKFAGAYRFVAITLPRHTVDGKAYNVIAANSLLERGVRERPDDWRIAFFLGFVQSFYLGDMASSARNIGQAASFPEAPGYLRLLATRLAADAGQVDMAEQMALAMMAQASDPAAREEWRSRLVALRMERDLRSIEEAAKAYRARTAAWPGWPDPIGELVRAGLLASVPREPHGGRYVFDPAAGEARSTAAPRLTVRRRAGAQSGLEVH